MNDERSAQEAILKAAVLEFMQFKYSPGGLRSLERCNDKRGSALTVLQAIIKDSPELYDRLKEHYTGQHLKQRAESCITLIVQASRAATVGDKELSSKAEPRQAQRTRRSPFVSLTPAFMGERK